MTDFLNSLQGNSVQDARLVLLGLLLAFLLSHVVAFTYSLTYRGLSYSRYFIQTLVMGGVVAAMLMLAIGNNIVWGLGIVGTLAIVRFRTNLRDPRDMIFVFASLAAGIASGVGAYAVAVLGTTVFCLASFYLAFVPFGARYRYDGLLRFACRPDEATREQVEKLLRQHCSTWVMVSLQQAAQREEAEHAYQVSFRRDESRFGLTRDFTRIDGLRNLSLLMMDEQAEV